MTIRIEQTLHGYEIGHQLLMSSTPLTSDAKQTLLVQSDLSGSNIDEFFKSYLTGYPLGNYYAFSKTWYADEMPRPGCVWTQTLLIAFADLGKIPDLQQLCQFFKRPIKDVYDDYASTLFLNLLNTQNNDKSFVRPKHLTNLLQAVYEEAEKSILLPALSSQETEDAILELWSSQWPRLRRNFLFCSGALGIKLLERREFDLQVIPMRNAISIEMQSVNGFVVDPDRIVASRWIDILFNAPQNQIRRFLWVYGADIAGTRSNYIPLIELYQESLKPDAEISKVINLLLNSFSGPTEGYKLRSKLLTDGQVFHFSTRELLAYLLTSTDSIAQSLSSEELSERLATAYKSGEITLDEFIDFYFNSVDKLSESIWSSIIDSPTNLLKLVAYDHRLLKVFKEQIGKLIYTKELWQTSGDLQYQILEQVETFEQVNWEQVLQAMLASQGEIIYKALANDNRRVILLFRLLNLTGYNISPALYQCLFQQYKAQFIGFILDTSDALSPHTCCIIFQKLNYHEINALQFDSAKWIDIYRKINDEPTRIFASCVLLSLSFNRKVRNPVVMVIACFVDVFYYAKQSKLTGNEWNVVPIDRSEEDNDEDLLINFFNYINLFSPKKSNVPHWDYCELLLRTLVNKFIKNNWPRQSLLRCLSTPELTEKFIRYCLSFKKGQRLLKEILVDIGHKRIDLDTNQYSIFGNYNSQVNW